jgi:aminotransferase
MDWQAERMKTIPFSGIRRVFEAAGRLEAQGKRVIHLEIGRPDFDTPVHIKEAAKKALDDGKVAYTSNWGILELREAIAAKMAMDNNMHADPKTEVVVTLGANEAVFIAMMSTLNPGDEVLVPDPTWPHYPYCAQMAGAQPASVPLREEQGFLLDPEDVRARITPRTRMLVVNTPHNPTGATLDLKTLEELAEIAIEHNLLVLSDEIYEKLIYDGAKHYSIASLPGMWGRTLTVNGFSKVFAMTGWRLGYLVGPRNLIGAAVRVHQYTTTCANSFAQYGALAALEGPQECVQEMVSEFDRRRCLVISALESIEGLSCTHPPRGAFYIFPSLKALGLSSEAFVEFLLSRAQVATVPGPAFGMYGEGYIRLAYSTSYDDIAEGLERIGEALKQLK